MSSGSQGALKALRQASRSCSSLLRYSAPRTVITTPHTLKAISFNAPSTRPFSVFPSSLSASEPKEQSSTSASSQEEVVISADDNNFDAIIDVPNRAPVLVDFYANWCGPCRAISPILAKVAKEKGIRLVKVDVEESQAVAAKYNIASLPTVSLFRDGKPVDQFLGMRNDAFIRDFISKHQDS